MTLIIEDDVAEIWRATQITLGTGLTIAEDSDGIPILTASVGGPSDLDDLTDVVITSPATGHYLEHNGTNWVNRLGVDAADVQSGSFTGTYDFDNDVTMDAQLVFSAAVTQIIPGATSLSIRNTADSQDNLIITDAGAVTIAGALNATGGGSLGGTFSGNHTYSGEAVFANTNAIRTGSGDMIRGTVDTNRLIMESDVDVDLPNSVQLSSRESLMLTFDSDDSQTNATFTIRANTLASGSGLLVFSITEAGVVTVPVSLTITSGGAFTGTFSGNHTYSGDVTFSSPILASAGTASLPGYAFSSDPDLGMYRVSSNRGSLAAGTVSCLEWTNSNTTVFMRRVEELVAGQAVTFPHGVRAEGFYSTEQSAVSMNLTVGVIGADRFGMKSRMLNNGADAAFDRFSFWAEPLGLNTSGTIAKVGGLLITLGITGSGGTTTNSYGIYINPNYTTGAIIGDAHGIHISPINQSATATNHYGFKINDLTMGTNVCADMSTTILLYPAVITGAADGATGAGVSSTARPSSTNDAAVPSVNEVAATSPSANVTLRVSGAHTDPVYLRISLVEGAAEI